MWVGVVCLPQAKWVLDIMAAVVACLEDIDRKIAQTLREVRGAAHDASQRGSAAAGDIAWKLRCVSCSWVYVRHVLRLLLLHVRVRDA